MRCTIAWDKEIECDKCGICAGKIIPISSEMPIGKIEWMIEEIIEAGRIDMSIRRNGEHIEIKHDSFENGSFIFILSERMEYTRIDNNNISLTYMVIFKINTFLKLSFFNIDYFHLIVPVHRESCIKIRQNRSANNERQQKTSLLPCFFKTHKFFVQHKFRPFFDLFFQFRILS